MQKYCSIAENLSSIQMGKSVNVVAKFGGQAAILRFWDRRFIMHDEENNMNSSLTMVN